MASDEVDGISHSEINLDTIVPIIRSLMEAVKGRDRTEAGAAFLIAYFMMAAPRPLTKREIAAVISEGSAALLPILINVIVNAGDYVPLNIPTKES